jgi:hypothetical protein
MRALARRIYDVFDGGADGIRALHQLVDNTRRP